MTLTLTFPDDVAFYAAQADLDKFSRTLAGPDWFAFQPSKDVVRGVIDMDRWLDGPAGKHGGVRIVKDGFAFEDGTPVKFWGVNLSYAASARTTRRPTSRPPASPSTASTPCACTSSPTPRARAASATRTTPRPGTPKGLDQLDYFASKLKEHGVYFGWSHTYGFHVVPGDRKRLLAYDEIEKNLKGNTYAFINFAEDVQDLMIEKVVNLLKHKNPYTGKTYAEEPALCFIELQNEDDIFFYTSESAFNACPTYKKQFLERFAAWLKDRYGSQEKLQAAWGDALQKGETLADANITPQLNPWFFGEDHLPGQKGGARQRLLDTAAFLHDVQDRFYSRFVKAIRDAGYKGPLNGSPWQAPSMLPHYYNLNSDYQVGYIDRHNYFDGKGPEMFASMLTHPGSGYLGSGLQQVIDRPFGLSEWIHVYPNVYAAEGPAIVAAYGMGLQGWDASYEFQSQADRRVFDDTAGGFPWGVWEADVPTSLGQFPALARMIYRGDVKEGEVISVRRVSPADLAEGKFSFSDKVEQQRRRENLRRQRARRRALAAGRVVVEFTDKSQPSAAAGHEAATARARSSKSTTGQLAWDTSDKGFFTVNTAGTKAVVGFTGGKEQTLGDVKIKLDTPFASLFLTALEPGEDLANGKRALITRDGPREQHRLHLLRARQPGPEERRAADPAGAGEGDGDHRGPADCERERPRPRRPPHRPNACRDGRTVHARRGEGQGHLLRSGVPLTRSVSIHVSTECVFSPAHWPSAVRPTTYTSMFTSPMRNTRRPDSRWPTACCSLRNWSACSAPSAVRYLKKSAGDCSSTDAPAAAPASFAAFSGVRSPSALPHENGSNGSSVSLG